MMTIPPKHVEDFQRKTDRIQRDMARARSRPFEPHFLDRLERASSWLEKGVKEVQTREYEQAFLALWIAFHALYGVPERQGPEQARISEYLGLLDSADRETLWATVKKVGRNVNLAEFLHIPSLIEHYWNESSYEREIFAKHSLGGTSMLQSLHDGEVQGVLEGIIARISVLRNQILHGCSTKNQGVPAAALLPSLQVLMILLPSFWTIMLKHGDRMKWGDLAYPRIHAPMHPPSSLRLSSTTEPGQSEAVTGSATSSLKFEPSPPDPEWPRYSTRPFPPYRFVPGQVPHPRKDPRGHSYGQPVPTLPAFSPEKWLKSDWYLYGIDLYNFSYWWECQEVFEGLRRAAGAQTKPGRFLQALSHIADVNLAQFVNAARIMGGSSPDLARSHLLEMLQQLPRLYPRLYLGVNVPLFTDEVRKHFELLREQPALIRLTFPSKAPFW